jgi:hypothetical protein
MKWTLGVKINLERLKPSGEGSNIKEYRWKKRTRMWKKH